MIGGGHESNGLYYMDLAPTNTACSAVKPDTMEMHCQFGHLSLKILRLVCPSLECQSYQLGKQSRVSFSPRCNKRATAPFNLVHSDI